MEKVCSYLRANSNIGASLFLIFLSINPFESLGQGFTECGMNPRPACPIVGEPHLYIPDVAGIQRYLARSIQYNNRLAEYNTWDTSENNPCRFWNTDTNMWDMCPDCLPQPHVIVGPSCAPAVTPVSGCECTYCRERYCRELDMLTQLNITFIARAAALWVGFDLLYDDIGHIPHYKIAVNQLVKDINNRYDCAGLRRPIIQAGILEHVDESAQGIVIPENVSSVFEGEMTTAEINYYLSGTNRNFNVGNIYFLTTDNEDFTKEVPDITRIEAKMWFYYLAKMYIDAGFTSLHMGDAQKWSYHDIPNYDHTYNILSKIRAYAANKGQLLVMNSELSDIYHNGGLLFDFNNVVARPREYPPHPEDRRVPCTEPEQPENLFDNTPCAGVDIMAVIDPCHSKTIGLSNGGTTPLGNSYDITPYFISFDFGAGIHQLGPDGNPGGPPDYYEGIEACYYYDDQAWFYQLPDDCKQYWMTEYICKVRQFDNGQGFLSLPGDVSFNVWDSLINGGCNRPPHFALSDHPQMIKAINDIWAPHDLAMTVVSYCKNPKKICRIDIEKIIYREQNYNLHMEVDNPDCTSVYSWHIQKSDGSWLPFTYGPTRDIESMPDGTYTISLRQDNFGLDASLNGAREIQTTVIVDKKGFCCTLAPDEFCKISNDEYDLYYDKDDDEKSETHNVYDFLVEIKGEESDTVVNISLTNQNSMVLEDLHKGGKFAYGRYWVEKNSSGVDTFKTNIQIREVEKEETKTAYTQVALSGCSGKDSAKIEERSNLVQQLQTQVDLKIYPNPALVGHHISISHPAITSMDKYKITIFNSLGLKIGEQFESANNNATIILQNDTFLKNPGLLFIFLEKEAGGGIAKGVLVVAGN